MTKTLSRCAIAELGIEDMMAGKTYAYTAVMSHGTYGLGLAVANERGYHPIPLFFAQAETYDEASDMSDELNRTLLELNDQAAARIVCSSMAAGR